MYWRYVSKRIGYGILTFITIIFIYSALFNTTMERTVFARIEEEIRAESMAMTYPNMSAEEIRKFMNERRIHKYRQYHLDTSGTASKCACPLWVQTHFAGSE